jgi:hypothetical protein
MAAAGESDPLKTVADAMDAAVQAVREGAADARETAAKAVPAAGLFLSRFMYTTCYTLSYGVVFPTMFVAKSIPANNPIVLGLKDGARAAIDMVDEMKAAKPGPALVDSSGEPLAST